MSTSSSASPAGPEGKDAARPGAPAAGRPIAAATAPPRTRPSFYPEPFASMVAGRVKRPLGDLFGLRTFGVNLTRLAPGAITALHHRHSLQDEFVYVLEGHPTVFVGDVESVAGPGDCIGFPAGGEPHHLANRTEHDVVILEVGDRAEGDEVTYPADDLAARRTGNGWVFVHKDGTSY